MKQTNLISIIIPLYNEEKNILPIFESVKKTWEILKNRYAYEIIFIDDGSRDQSLNLIKEIALKNKEVKFIEFSRNFGKEIAVTAGLHLAKGNAALIMDADLQHPPEIIPQFLKKWEEGADIVIGVRVKNKSESLFRRLSSSLFHRVSDAICDIKLTDKETDFRLLDKKVVDQFNGFTERNRITRGLIDWLGFKKDFIPFTAPERNEGASKYNPLKLTKLAFSTFVSHSLFPLKLASYMGIFITFFSGILGVYIFIEKYILGDPFNQHFSGPAILAVIILFLVGIILICLGLVALYIANIHNEVINRPMYVINNKKI